MRPDDYRDRAVAQTIENLLLLPCRTEARQQLNADVKRGEPVQKRLVVLGGENGGGAE